MAPAPLRELASRLAELPGYRPLLTALTAGQGATLEGVWGSLCALAAASLLPHNPAPLVVVWPHADDLDSFCDDLRLFSSVEPEVFPAWETFRREQTITDEIFGDRLRLLKHLASPTPPRCVVTNIQALLQGVPSRQRLAEHGRTLRVGETLDLDPFYVWLAEQGFHGSSAVQLPGEFSRRGGILDLFAPDWLDPVRIEFFGDEVESIRRFEVGSQRSRESLEAVELTIVEPSGEDRDQFFAYLPEQSWIMLVEPNDLREEAQRFLTRVERPADYHAFEAVMAETYGRGTVLAERIGGGGPGAACRVPAESVERFSGDVTKLKAELDSAEAGNQIHIVCQTEAEAHRLQEVFAGSTAEREQRLNYPIGNLRGGFRLIPQQTVLISGGELFQRTETIRTARRRLGRVIDSFLELKPGDLVVHISHGIARYRGLKLLEKGDQVEEHLQLEFREGTKIFVPTSKIELVQKYVGGTKSRPTLAKIGGAAWNRQKKLAEDAVMDLASDYLELQAARASLPGIPFVEQSEWQREFEASFPYTETPDQLTAVDAIRLDMSRARPMDRLICGDVGYGKTEVAMRAAFRAVDSGYQVAVLVPTTILAEQHFRTFSSRMAEYPFSIASLSRFSTKKEQKAVIEKLNAGSVDVVIGTHRLAQADVQFANLGLVIIDEEQRFGVDIKERLKQLRKMVDVLTLTATPIPRTLHMSLLGLRDISNLETPPAERQPVETHVTRFDGELIRHAILRELNRGGQIYFVHNRIEDIEKVAIQIRRLAPEVKLKIGHGQMREHELEKVMMKFVAGEFDLLLATTIIESGLDIARANTIFINEGDRYGLADLHQLRGRVGRHKHRAYCYVLVDPNKSVTPDAARRLTAIEEFSNMGAGFAIAMRDLEIRGAGNILGTEQSGHINAVGYELYCQLLEHAVRRLKKMPPRMQVDVNVDLPLEAFLPRDYVPDMRLKIDLYRRLARVASEADLSDFRDELLDRFGHLPEVVERLLRVMRLRILAQTRQITSMYLEDHYLVFTYVSRPAIERLAKASNRKLRVVDDKQAYFDARPYLNDRDSLLAAVEMLLEND